MGPALFDMPEVGAPRPVTLVRLSAELARAVSALGKVAVEGEVYKPTTTRGGVVFFVLRDRSAQVTVRVPAASARRCRAVAGERVCVVARTEWAPERGNLYLVAEEVSPLGEGAVAARLAEIRARLSADGLLDRPRRRLPLLPERIGVVCGTDSAVRRDIESVVAARFAGYPLVFAETTVSGAGAAISILEAFSRLASLQGVEVILLARGGGDAPSLLPWSDEELCRVIAASPIPVVSAIGHEGDRPLCDEVADRRCGTPSLGAAAVVPDREGLQGWLDTTLNRAATALDGRCVKGRRQLERLDARSAWRMCVLGAEGRLSGAGTRLRYGHPARLLEGARSRLAGCDWRRPMGVLVGRASGRLEADARHLSALSPTRVLERGYAVVRGPGGSEGPVLRCASSVAPGDVISVGLAEGSLTAEVTDVG
ncbi:MAG: exodeoxyribonuclease VII large subunit [Acidimicrobiales bacterium]